MKTSKDYTITAFNAAAFPHMCLACGTAIHKSEAFFRMEPVVKSKPSFDLCPDCYTVFKARNKE